MADEDVANGLGFDDPSLAFIDDGHTAVTGASLPGPQPLTHAEVSQSFLSSQSGWEISGIPSVGSYDIRTTTTAAPSISAGYVSPSWQPDNFRGLANAPSFNLANIYGSMPLPPEQGNMMAPPSQHHGCPAPTLTPDDQEKLRNIAMPPEQENRSPKSTASLESSKTGVGSSPDGSRSSQKTVRKRKISAELDDDDDALDEPGKPIKKTAHNMIEKRYRTNINDKIAALRDSVPSLRIMCKSARGEDTTEDREELHGLTPAHKLNKATVLSKATEYIRHLEKRNSRLLEENGVMHARIAAFEKLFMAGAMGSNPMSPMQQPPGPSPMAYPPPHDNQHQMAVSPMEGPTDANGIHHGLMEVPEGVKRMISAQMTGVGPQFPAHHRHQHPHPHTHPHQNQHQNAHQFQSPNSHPDPTYRFPNTAIIQQQQIQQQQQRPQQEQGQQGGWPNVTPYLGKLMVGSLAGLMIMEAVQENESSNEQPQGRGLFALPLQILELLPSTIHFRLLSYHADFSVKLLLLLGVVLWVFIPSLFIPSSGKSKRVGPSLHMIPSPASPIYVRRLAWLTAIQTVWVPHHNLFLEAAALSLKMIKLSLRNTFGDPAYQTLIGVTPEQETARVKAWSIALDSQLAGGDADICMSRLILTLMASGTLPNTPIRLMLKALHLRVLLWDLGRCRCQLGLVDALAAWLARSRWNEARELNRLLSEAGQSSSIPSEDELPEHLAALVERECDEVMTDTVLQRAYNLAFNKEMAYETEAAIDCMNAVADDNAVGSPMDAIAAWWSSELLHDVMLSSLAKDSEAVTMRDQTVELALKVAPIGSLAQTRALLARAVLTDKDRGSNIAAVVKIFQEENVSSLLAIPMPLIEHGNLNNISHPTTVIRRTSHVFDLDFKLSLQCATALGHIKRKGLEPLDENFVVSLVQRIRNQLDGSPKSLSLLGFTSTMELTDVLVQQRGNFKSFSPLVESLVGSLRRWMGDTAGSNCGAGPVVQDLVIHRCLTTIKKFTGMGQIDEEEDLGDYFDD